MTDAEHTEAWLPIKEAAKRLGLSEKALRSRIVRRTLRSRRGNDGRVHVLVRDTPAEHAPGNHRAMFGAEHTEERPPVSEHVPPSRQTVGDASEAVPVSVMQGALEALQAAHSEALAAILAQHREQLERQEQRHRHELAERDGFHQATVADLKRVIAGLTEALAERRKDVPETLPRPWWAPSWIGNSKRSKIR